MSRHLGGGRSAGGPAASGWAGGRTEREGEGHWAELVDLYEYRVADVLAGRTPRGGRRSLITLRELLLPAPLDPALYRRLIEADRQYRRHASGGVRRGPPAPDAPSTWEAPMTGSSPEARAWRDLHLLAWGDRAQAGLHDLLLSWQREAGLLKLRVLYAALENAERAAAAGGGALAVPAAHDPLVDLHDREVLAELARSAVRLLLRDDGRARLQTALSEVHEDPFPRHPDEDVWRARLAAAAREPLAPEARQTLMDSLRGRHAPPRDPRERPAIREAARAVVQHLETALDRLGAPPHGEASTVPHHSILYAEGVRSALPAPDDGAGELVVHLRGGSSLRWRGTEFSWQPVYHNWQLQADRTVVMLRPQEGDEGRSVTLDVPGGGFRAFVSGAYLLLRAQTRPHEQLARRASLGRAVALLLEPAGAYAALRLARATAQLLRDQRVDTAALSAGSARTYRAASQEALLHFARKGADTLRARLLALTPGDAARHIQDAAATLNLGEDWACRLTTALHVAAHRPEPLGAVAQGPLVELPPDGSFLSVPLGDEPLHLQVGSRTVTLRRDFKGELAAILPGHPALVLHDLLVLTVPPHSVILAREGDWLAAAAAPRPAQQEDGGTDDLLATPQP